MPWLPNKKKAAALAKKKAENAKLARLRSFDPDDCASGSKTPTPKRKGKNPFAKRCGVKAKLANASISEKLAPTVYDPAELAKQRKLARYKTCDSGETVSNRTVNPFAAIQTDIEMAAHDVKGKHASTNIEHLDDFLDDLPEDDDYGDYGQYDPDEQCNPDAAVAEGKPKFTQESLNALEA